MQPGKYEASGSRHLSDVRAVCENNRPDTTHPTLGAINCEAETSPQGEEGKDSDPTGFTLKKQGLGFICTEEKAPDRS